VLVKWLVEGGRRALFANFGLGKTMIQLEALRLVQAARGSPRATALMAVCLIVIPLTVVTEFKTDAAKLGIDVRFVRTTARSSRRMAAGLHRHLPDQLRERARGEDRHVDPDRREPRRGVVPARVRRDQDLPRIHAAVRRGALQVRRHRDAEPERIYRAARLRRLPRSDGRRPGQDPLLQAQQREGRPAHHPPAQGGRVLAVGEQLGGVHPAALDLGFSDEGYDLPPIEVRWHEVPSDHRKAGEDAFGQGRLLKADAIGIVDASREKRESLGVRIAKMQALLGRG
jgi:hypothetical protein